MSDEKIKGKVKWFDSKKGYGFIESEGEKDIFVHFSEIIQEGYKTLKDGDEVEFILDKDEQGDRAKGVSKIAD